MKRRRCCEDTLVSGYTEALSRSSGLFVLIHGDLMLHDGDILLDDD
jgi:hypothetical protein